MALPNLRANRRLIARRRWSTAAFFVAVAGGAACSEPTDVMDDASYVEIMARLSDAQARYIDPVRSDSAKIALLDELGVDPEDLVAFSERYGGDIERMNELWRRISARVDSLGAEEMTTMPGQPDSESPEEDRP